MELLGGVFSVSEIGVWGVFDNEELVLEEEEPGDKSEVSYSSI